MTVFNAYKEKITHNEVDYTVMIVPRGEMTYDFFVTRRSHPIWILSIITDSIDLEFLIHGYMDSIIESIDYLTKRNEL